VSALFALMVACHCGPAPESVPPDETGPLPDTHDSAPPEAVTLQVALALPEDTLLGVEATVAVVHVRFGEGPLIGETIVSIPATLGEPALLELPLAAPVEHHEALGNLYLPVTGSLYMLVAFQDDGDGLFQEGEPLLGVAMDRWVMWYELDLVLDDSGAEAPARAWRVVDLGIAGQYAPNRCALDTSWPLEWMMDAGYPVYHPVEDAVSLPLRGLEARLELAGTIRDLPEESLRLAALPYPHLGERAVSAGFDQALAPGQTDFEALLVDAPPAEDDVGSDPDWRYTMHLLLPYSDEDGSGDFGRDDALEGSSTCLDGEHVWPRYTRPVSTYRGYRFLDCYDGTVGWRLVRYAEHGGVEYLGSEQARGIGLDFTDCRLD
jgi:hypothetical protein